MSAADTHAASPRRPDRSLAVGFVLIGLAALACRVAVLSATNLDLEDHFLRWLLRIRLVGFWTALSTPFSAYGYTPVYTYLLGLSNAVLPAGTDGKTVIKAISIVFDYADAALMVAIARLRYGRHDWRQLVAFAAVLFAPTVFLNGAYWGQSDIIYAGFLLLAVYLQMRGHATGMMVAFGIALATKAQAGWFAPFVLLLLLRGEARWRDLAWVPAMYALFALPAWAAGRGMRELATIYLTQLGTQADILSFSAPNLLTPLGIVVGRHPAIAHPVILALTLLAVVMSLAYALAGRRAPGTRLDGERLLLAAVVSVLLVPGILPHMHNRYFFAADLLTIALAVWVPSLWFVPVALQFASGVSYISFLTRDVLPAEVPPWLAVFGFTNNLQPVTGLITIGGCLTAGLAWLLWRRYRRPVDPAAFIAA